MRHPHLIIFAAALGWAASLAAARAQLYVLNQDDGAISVYDTASGRPIRAPLLQGLHRPAGMALREGYLYVTEQGTGAVSKFTTTGFTVARPLVAGLNTPEQVAVTGEDLYVTSYSREDGVEQGSGQVGRYDAVTGAAISPWLISMKQPPIGLAVWNNILFLSHGIAVGGLSVYDRETGAVVSQRFVSDLPGVDHVIISNDYLWSLQSIAHGPVFKHEVQTGLNAMGPRQPLVDGLDHPISVAVSGNDIFVLTQDNAISKYSASTGELLQRKFLVARTGTLCAIAAVEIVVPADAAHPNGVARAIQGTPMFLQYVPIHFSDLTGLIATVVVLAAFYFWWQSSAEEEPAPASEHATEETPEPGEEIAPEPAAQELAAVSAAPGQEESPAPAGDLP